MSLEQAQKVTPLQHTVAQMRNPTRGLIGYAALMSTMRVTEAKVGTAATDTVSYVYVDPDFMESLNLSQRLFVLVHETLHKFQGFFERFEIWAKRHPQVDRRKLLEISNKSADFLINHTIYRGLRLELPPGVLYNVSLNNSTCTIESLADRLMAGEEPENQNPDPGQGDPGQGDPQPGDGMRDGSDVNLPDMYAGDIQTKPSEGQLKEHTATIRKDMANAARAAKAAGDKSGFNEMLADEAMKDKVNWAEVLRRWATNIRNTGSLTFSRPNRRYRIPGGRVSLPTRRSRSIGDVCIVMDTSCSMLGELMSQVMAEAKATLRTVDFETLHVLHVDTEVQKALTFSKGELHKWTPEVWGGGCTAFAPAFKYAYRELPKLCGIIYHSDGYTSERDISECEDLWIKMGQPHMLWAINDMSPERFAERCKFGTIMDCR